VKKLGFGLLALVFVIALARGHGNNSSDSSTAAAADTGSAKITMLHGRTSDNACTEEDGEARIYVIFTLKNTGDADGTVNPWATFDYSDGGHSSETYFSNHGEDLTVPAHSEIDATFYHTFNPQQHAMIRCAGYADLGDSEAAGFYLPIS
jgi:hypothetical protein